MKVLLVDDHAVVRAGFRMLLSAQPFIDDIVDINRGESALSEYKQFQPDVVVMDLSMPGIGGLEAIRRLLKQDSNAVVLVYSIHDEAIYIDRALQAGAKGYVSKNSAPEILADAVQAVVNGQQYIESKLAVGLEQTATENVDKLRLIVDALSAREFDVFCLIAKGLTVQDAASQLCLSYKTVANYTTKIKHRLSVNTAADFAHTATILGLIKH